MMEITYENAPFGSDHYHQSVALRETVLRIPLGMRTRPEDVAQDESQTHFVALHQGRVVATVSHVPISATHAKLRQMAVDSTYQGQGIGNALIRYAHRALAKRGIAHVTLHARIDATGFYERLGYTAQGELFTEIGIIHQRMDAAL